MSRRRKFDTKRTFSLFVASMFILSMVGAVYEIKGSSQKNNTWMETGFIERALTSQEKYAVISSGKTLIELEKNSSCGTMCYNAENMLRRIHQDYKPYVVVSVFEGASNQITLTGYYGSVEKYDLSQINYTIIEDFICERTPRRIDRCILRKMM